MGECLFSTIEIAAKDSWEEDFRRCRVLKQFSQGTIDISMDEKMLGLEVQWDDRTDLGKVSARTRGRAAGPAVSSDLWPAAWNTAIDSTGAI
jgi:hypothetical protein